MKYITLCLSVLSCFLLGIGCKKAEKQKLPFGQIQCNGYEHVWYLKDDSTQVWTGNTWEWQHISLVDSNRIIPNQLVAVEAGSEGVLILSNLIKNADPAVLPGLDWSKADKFAVYLSATDSANHEKTYKRVLPQGTPERGLVTAPFVIVTLTFDYVTSEIDIMYASYIRQPHDVFTSNTIYLRNY